MWSYLFLTFTNGTDITGGATAGLGAVLDSTGDGFSAPSSSLTQLDNDVVGGVINDYDLANGVIAHALQVIVSSTR